MSPKKTKKFEEVLLKLEEMVERLESGDLSLEESLSTFKDGVELVKIGTNKLNEMEQKVELLLKDVEKEQTVPFEEQEEIGF